MTDDEQAMENAVIVALEPVRELFDRMMTQVEGHADLINNILGLVERLTARVEVLELERLSRAEYDRPS